MFLMLPCPTELICSQWVEVRARDFNETLFAVWKCCSLCGEIDCLYILLMICPLPSVLVRRKAGQHPQGQLTHISVSYYIVSLLFIASLSTTEKSQYTETSCTTNFPCSSVIFYLLMYHIFVFAFYFSLQLLNEACVFFPLMNNLKL